MTSSSIRCTRALPSVSHGRDAVRACAPKLAATGTPDKPRDIWKCQPDKHTRTNVSSPRGRKGNETLPFLGFLSPLFFTAIFVTDQEMERKRDREYRIYVNGLLKKDDAERCGTNGRVILGWKSMRRESFFLLFSGFGFFCKMEKYTNEDDHCQICRGFFLSFFLSFSKKW